MQPLISPHFNLTVEMPLKALVRGYSYAVVPITWTNRAAGVSKLKIKEMGSRYLFIVLYLWLEKHLSRGDYHRKVLLRRTRGPPTSMHETVLITGGAGFVGSTLAIAIRRAHPGTAVIAFDNLQRRGSELNLPRLKAEGVRFVHGDVRSLADLTEIAPGAGPDSGMLGGALGARRIRRFTGVSDPHQSDRLLPLPGGRHGRLKRISCSSRPAASTRWRWSTRLAYDEGPTRFTLRPEQTHRRRQRARDQRGVSAGWGAVAVRHDETGGGVDGGRVRRRVRDAVHYRPLRPAHRTVADGEGGPGSGGVVGGRALLESRIEVYRVRRDRQAGPRLPAHRRLLRPGAGPDRERSTPTPAATGTWAAG